MKIVQTIFGPDQNQLNRNIASLKSLAAYLSVYPAHVELTAGGWCASKELWSQYDECVAQLPFKSSVMKFHENRGKSYTVNMLVNTVSDAYFLTLDSDILFDANVPHVFERLMQSPSKCAESVKKQFGAIALNQTQMSCHVYDKFVHKFSYVNAFGDVENMAYSDSSSGIAGGCIFTSLDNWKTVGGYRLINVYGGDDGYFMLDTVSRNRSCVVALDISIIHPFDTDVPYIRWKSDQEPDGERTQQTPQRIFEHVR